MTEWTDDILSPQTIMTENTPHLSDMDVVESVARGSGNEHPSGQPQVSRGAFVSLLLGLGSLVLFAVTGIPALIVGILSLRKIHASEGRLTGSRLALVGISLGGLGVALTLLGCFALVVLHLNSVSRETECTNNLRQLGLAFNKYHDENGHFPAAVIQQPDFLPPEQRLSWQTGLLPFLGADQEQGQFLEMGSRAKFGKLAAQLDYQAGWKSPANASVVSTSLRVFLCPGDGRPRARTNAWTSYVGLAGIGPEAARLPKTSPGAGVFRYQGFTAREDVDAGISATLMVLETQQDNGPWAAGGTPTLRELNPEEQHYLGDGRPFGGLHPGKTHALWVDGHARPISNSVGPTFLRTHVTLHE